MFRRRIIGVHGFGFDPASDRNDPWRLFHDWADMLQAPVDGFAWYSSAATVGGILKALAHGFGDRYAYAYQRLAVDAAAELAKMIVGTGGPASIVCHSLGSRVTLQALRLVPRGTVDRVLILDGAELQAPAIAALNAAQARPGSTTPAPLPRILNVCARHDRVLADLGSWASGTVGKCIGHDGLGANVPGWTDVYLDDQATQTWALDRHEWALEAFNPLDPAGHWESYTLRGNWPLYRHFLVAGEEPFEGLPAAAAA